MGRWDNRGAEGVAPPSHLFLLIDLHVAEVRATLCVIGEREVGFGFIRERVNCREAEVGGSVGVGEREAVCGGIGVFDVVYVAGQRALKEDAVGGEIDFAIKAGGVWKVVLGVACYEELISDFK